MLASWLSLIRFFVVRSGFAPRIDGWQVMCRLQMFDQAFEALEVMERGGFEYVMVWCFVVWSRIPQSTLLSTYGAVRMSLFRPGAAHASSAPDRRVARSSSRIALMSCFAVKDIMGCRPEVREYGKFALTLCATKTLLVC